MADFESAVAIYTNFITPPDFLDEDKHSVLLIDVLPSDVEALAFYCREQSNESFNVYLYNYTMEDSEWLFEAIKRSDVIIVNMIETSISSTKFKIIEMTKALYYGLHKNTITTPMEYFVNYKGDQVQA